VSSKCSCVCTFVVPIYSVICRVLWRSSLSKTILQKWYVRKSFLLHNNATLPKICMLSGILLRSPVIPTWWTFRRVLYYSKQFIGNRSTCWINTTHLSCNISNTRKSVFIRISKHRKVGWKNEAQPSIFYRHRGVWIPDETLFRVFDVAS